MGLPPRNILIRCVYALTMISMFLFLAWESWLPVTEQATVTIQNESSTAVVKHVSTQAIAPIKQRQPPSSNTEHVASFQVYGVSKLIDLKANPEQQINLLWDKLFNSPLAQQINPEKPVYAIYSDYDDRNNTATLTLGITKLVSGVRRISIHKGNYKKFRNETVLEAWQKTAAHYQNFRYQRDFELWKLDKNYQPISVTTYLGTK